MIAAPTVQYPVPPDLVRALRDAGEVIVRSFAEFINELGAALGRALGARSPSRDLAEAMAGALAGLDFRLPGPRSDQGDPCGDGPVHP